MPEQFRFSSPRFPDQRSIPSFPVAGSWYPRIPAIPTFSPQPEPVPPPPPRPMVFLVHRRNPALRSEVARFLEKGGAKVVILNEHSTPGQSLLDELIKYSRGINFAVVLATADDEGHLKGPEQLRSRARQNVVLELGYFLGRLGKGKVAVLADTSIDHPSDYHGTIHIPLRGGDDWRVPLAKAIKTQFWFNDRKALDL